MRKAHNWLRQLIGVFAFLILAVVLVYILRWGREFSIADSFAGSGVGTSVYPPPDTQTFTSIPSTPYPGPPETQGTQPVQSNPTTRATLVPVPPPGWPTNEPWPPEASKRTPFPTDNYPLFPTPDHSLLKTSDQLPDHITLWFPYFEKADVAPILKEARIDAADKTVEVTPLDVELMIPAPIIGPDPGPVLVDFHLSTDSRWLVADFAYSGSRLIDLKTGKPRQLAINLPSPYWKFVSWVSNNPVKLLAFGSEVPARNAQLVNVDTAEVEQANFLEREEIGNGDLTGIAYSPDGTNRAIAVVKPPTAGVRQNWVAEVCLQDCKTRKIAEIEGGASFVDGSLGWSPTGRDLGWTVLIMGVGGKLEAQSWIYNLDTEAAKRLDVFEISVKNIYPPAWSPDGTTIAVLKTVLSSEERKEVQNIFLINVITGEKRQITDFPNYQLSHLQWLPDGYWLAFTVSRGDYGEIWITNLDGRTILPFAGPTIPNAPYLIFDEPETGPTSTHPGSNKKMIFPTQQLINGERVSLGGLTQGILVASDNCIRLNEDNSDLSFMIIWPPDYKYSIEDEMISVLNGDGTLMAKVGDEVKISGGGVEILSALPKYIQDQMSSTCAPPYWMMGDEIYVIDGGSP